MGSFCGKRKASITDTPTTINMSWGTEQNSQLLLRCPDISKEWGVSSTGKTTIIAFSKGERKHETGVSVEFLVYRPIDTTFNKSGLAKFGQGWRALPSGAQNLEGLLDGKSFTLRCDLARKPRVAGDRKVIATTGYPVNIGSSGLKAKATVY